MRKALHWVTGAALLMLQLMPAFAQDATMLRELTPAESKAIDDKILSNWDVAAEPAISCKSALTFEVRMGQKGVVEEVILTDPKSLESSDPCRAAADLAQRAIWKSSPLPVPGKSSGLRLTFDASKFQ